MSETFISDNTLESFRMEYRTRHSIDGEIIDCESRISLVTGYMTHEVNGVNAINFIHRDDVRWVIIALREMYDQHRLVGESCYRLMTKSGKFIYMQTKGFLDVDQHSRAFTSFVITNTVVDEQIGKRLIKLMKKRFMLIVNNNEDPIPDGDDDTIEINDNALPVEDPRRLEKVILYLVTNLPSPQPGLPRTASPDHEDSSPFHLSIISPQKGRIVNAIEKIYSVIKTFNKEPISKMQPYKAIKENEQRNDEDIRKISNETVPTISRTSLTSVSVTDVVDSHSGSRLISLDNTSLQRPNRIFGSHILTPSMNIDPVSSTSFLQSSSTFIPLPGPSGFCTSVDPILLERFYPIEIDDDSNRYGSDSYAFEQYSRARSPTPFTTSVISENIYTTLFSTSSSVITSDTTLNSENIVNRPITMYSNTLRLSSFSGRHRIIRPSPDSMRLFQMSSGNHHLLSLNNDPCTSGTCFSNYETPLVNYFSPISFPPISYPSVITDTSSTFVADIIYPNCEMIIPTDTSTSIDRRYQQAHSLYDTMINTNRQLMESYRSDEQNNNNQPLPETVRSNQIDNLEENPMIVTPTSTSCGNESVPMEAKQLTHEIIGYTKSNMEPSISSAPISCDVTEPGAISCGKKRPNDEDIDEIVKKKIALNVTVDAKDSLVEESILCAKYLNNDDLIDSALEQEPNSASPELTVFVGLVRPMSETFISDNTLESFRMEYRTRHSIDGEIIDCESRISLVTGYMTHEVNGVNAINFIHRDDVRWVIIALREMYDQHRLVGESCYRLMTKSGKFIYMQTKGFLDVDQHSRAFTSFVITNTVVDEQIGKRLIKLMKKRFMLIVNNNEDPIPDGDDDTIEINDNALPVEDPRRLEKVILYLVTNLPSPQPGLPRTASPDHEDSSPFHLSIISPQKGRIVNAIEKIYSVIKTFNKEPISKMQPYKAIKENEQRNDEDIRKISNETVPTISRTSLTSVSVTDVVDSHSGSRLISLDNTSLQRPNRIFGSHILTPSMNIDPVSSTSFLQSSSTFIPLPGPSGFCTSVDPILLERFYPIEIDDDSNRYGSDSYAFEQYSRARSPTPFTTSVISENIYTTLFSTSSSVITSDTTLNSENIVNRPITMYSNTLRLSSFSGRHRIIRPSPDSMRLFQMSSGNHHLLSLNNDPCTSGTCFSNYETPLVNYFSPISFPPISYPSVITDTSSTFVADIIYPNCEMIIPTDTSTSIDRRYQQAHSLYDTMINTNRQLMESYRSDEQNNNNQPLPETVRSNQIDNLEENPMIVTPTSTSCGNESVPMEAKQLTHEIIGYTKSNMEPSISSAPISCDVTEPGAISYGKKRPNDEDIDEIVKKKIALNVTVDAKDSLVEESILCAKYLNNDDLIDSALEQEPNSASPELTPNEDKKEEK